MPVKLGIDVLREQDFQPLKDKRVGLLTNASGVDSQLESTFHILWNAPQVQLTSLFAPEHGIHSSYQTTEEFKDSQDKHTSLPIYSLYSENRQPTKSMLADLEAIVIDLQDTGVRFVTYAWTVMGIIDAAANTHVEVVILDRPNPLGGTISGGVLSKELYSPLGSCPVPIRHGMTLGELAQIYHTRWSKAKTKLSVIQCEGWSRDMTWAETGLFWVAPASHLPNPEMLRYFSGAGLLEGAQLSVGRGTTLPYQIVGAPYIDALALSQHLNRLQWDGVKFRPHVFRPTTGRYADEVCEGVQVHITDEKTYDPIKIWLAILREIRSVYPAEFEWLPPRAPGTEDGFFYHFDRLIGSYDVRPKIDAGVASNGLTEGWDEAEAEFSHLRGEYLLYE